MRKSVLILGASGRFGRHAAEAFWNAGWAIHTFDRMTDDLMQTAKGMDVIVAAWNPLYPSWATQLLPLHKQVQAAAKVCGATVIVPSNVYVYAPDAPQPWSPDTPHLAQNPLGRLRVEMEQSYRDSGVQTIFLRAGDFIDTEQTDSWLDKVILKSLHKGKLVYPGDLDTPHSWAYLPDLAQAATQLANQRIDLQQIEDITFEGYTLTGRDFAHALSQSMQSPVIPSQMSWRPLQAAQVVWPLARHLIEMRYLWDVPHRLDGSRLRRLCTDYRDTDLNEAMSGLIRTAIPSQPRPSSRCALKRGHLRLT